MEDFAGVEDSLWVEGLLDRALHVENRGIQFLYESVHLEQSEPVLAGDGTAQFDCSIDDLGERGLCAVTGGEVVVWGDEQGMKITVARAYREAQQTVDVLMTLGRDGEVSSAKGLGIYRILLSHLAREHLDELTEAEIGPLMAEQSRRGVPLVDTLSAYLAHGRHHAATASNLGVHVNTLYQRLDAIDRLIGTQWRDPDRALDLQVVLRLRRSAELLGK